MEIALECRTCGKCVLHVARCTLHAARCTLPVAAGFCFQFAGRSCVKNGNCVSAHTPASIALFRNCAARTKATRHERQREIGAWMSQTGMDGGGGGWRGGWPLIMQKTATTLKLPIAAHVIKDELRNATKHRGSFRYSGVLDEIYIRFPRNLILIMVKAISLKIC